MKKRLFYWFIFVCCLFSLMGCDVVSDKDVNENTQETAEYTGNWKEDGFYLDESVTIPLDRTNAPLMEADYAFLSKPEADFNYNSSMTVWGYSQDTVYAASTYETEAGWEYLLSMRSAEENRYKQVTLAIADETEALKGYITKLHVVDEDSLALLFAVGETKLESYRIFVINVNGTQEKEIILEDIYIANEGNFTPALFAYDNSGIAFLSNADKSKLYIFEEQGALLEQKEYTKESDGSLGTPFHTPDGGAIWPVELYEGHQTQLMWYDSTSQKFKTLQTLPHIAQNFCMNEAGVISYLANFTLYDWNLTTGKHELLFSLLDSNIDNSFMLGMGMKGQDRLLYFEKNGGLEYYVLSDHVEQADNTINIVNLDTISSYIKGAAASYSRKNPDVQIVYEASSGDTEDYRTQIMAEIVAGKGPDMLIVSREDMQILEKQGVLQDLSELIPDETMEQIFSGIREHGTIDGRYVGLTCEADANILMTCDTLWSEEYWTHEEVITLLEENPQIKGIIGQGDYENFTFMLNRAWLMRNIHDTPYLDLEKGICDFDNESFISFLETLKEYSTKQTYEEEGAYRVINSEFAAYNCSMITLPYATTILRDLDETCHFVGWPNQKDGIGYFSDANVLVINAKSMHMEEIKEFLSYLLSEEMQLTTDYIPVRADVIRDNIKINKSTNMNGEVIVNCTFGDGLGMEMKPDGTTYTEEIIDFLNHCSAMPYYPTAIENILEEECKLFYSGSIAAGEAAKNIQNRVQLYLDEQN